MAKLKTTQAQLIHSEKMASLGELTAGIAHEIQNPLNFVTNFSEVSRELIEKLAEELKQGHVQDVALLADVFSNAFHAVRERQRQQGSGYRPVVSVQTQQQDERIEIRVQDNGTGMAESIQSKVFQPFFTTKPTGQGTGLGLSLSYDIITKGHGGSLNVTSQEGLGAEFSISLPVDKVCLAA